MVAINPEEPIYIERRGSCTKDEAVAKLLGWMRSPIRHLCFRVDEYGCVLPEHLPTMHSLDVPLMDFLDGQYESARIAFLDAVEGDATLPEIQEREAAIPIWGKRIENALAYLRDIERELAKGKGSMLIEQEATDETEGALLTLESLNLWAMSKYGISTIAEDSAPQIQMERSLLPVSNSSASQAPNELPKLRAQEKAILDAIVDLGLDPKCLPRNGAGKRGVKFTVRAAMKGNDLFPSARVFDKAWERIRGFGDIADSEEVSSP